MSLIVICCGSPMRSLTVAVLCKVLVLGCARGEQSYREGNEIFLRRFNVT